MKKTLTVLAVMAIAASAYAEISTNVLGSWAFQQGGTSTKPDDYKVDGVTAVSFSPLSRINGLTTNGTSAGTFNSAGWTKTNETTGAQAGIELTVTISQGFQVANAGLHAEGVNGTGTGPKYLQWQLGGNDIGSVWEVSTTKTPKDLDIDKEVGTMTAGAYTFTEVASKNGGEELVNINGATLPSTGPSRMTGLEFRGDASAVPTPQVPEPATMSLLGLGALAMALRRKLRK